MGPKLKKWLTSLSYAVLIASLSTVVPRVLSSSMFQLFKIKGELGKGFHFNDFYYQFASNPTSIRPFDVVILNTERFEQSPAEFRTQLVELNEKGLALEPAAWGLDFGFSKTEASTDPHSQLSHAMLQMQVNQSDQMIVGAFLNDHHQTLVEDESRWGIVNFVDSGRVPIRQYAMDFVEADGTRIPSFAAKLVSVFRPNLLQDSDYPDCFPIRYRRHDLLTSRITGNDDDALPFRSTAGIPILDAADFLSSPSKFEQWIRGKIVIVGHASQNANDIEDKHRVPSDPHFSNRIPSVSGPVIHALAVDMLLDFDKRGWRYVPEGLVHVWLFLLLVSLIHLTLFTRAGNALNFILLALFSIPFLFVGLVLMQWRWYWPMTSTLLPLVFVEEIMEIIHPITMKVINGLRLQIARLKARLALATMAFLGSTGFLSDANAQSMDLMVVIGQAEVRTVDHTPGNVPFFQLYPGDTLRIDAESQILITFQNYMSVWEEGGNFTYEEIFERRFRDQPTLASEFLRVFFKQGGVNSSTEANIGAAIRGGEGLSVSPKSGQVVWEDSVWIGVNDHDMTPPPVDWIVRNQFKEVASEGRAEGGFWFKGNSGERYNFDLAIMGMPLSSGIFSFATTEDLKSFKTWKSRIDEQCTTCTPSEVDQLFQLIQHPTGTP